MREYRIVEKLGAGGMGTVYRGYREIADGDRHDVAIKIPCIGQSDGELRDMFIREAKTAIRFNHDHPNLVTVFDNGETSSGDLFLVMELVDGTTATRLCEREPLSPWMVRRIAHDILKALGYLSEHGVIHRDVSTGNILVRRDGRIKLSDFGLARSLGGSQTSVVRGTPAFASPERLRGAAQTTASDLFSLGAVLFKLATGKRPFAGRTVEEILRQMKRGIQDWPEELQDDLRELIAGLLEFDPSDRPTVDQALAIITNGEDRGTDREIAALVQGCTPDSSESDTESSEATTYPALILPSLGANADNSHQRTVPTRWSRI